MTDANMVLAPDADDDDNNNYYYNNNNNFSFCLTRLYSHVNIEIQKLIIFHKVAVAYLEM